MRPEKEKNWLIFEREVRDLVEAFGYRAEATQPSHDYGVDVIAQRQHRRVVVQCKLYGKTRVGGETISQLEGARRFHDASDAICITTGRFTRQALEIAGKLKIPLVDREKLMRLCRELDLTIPSLTAIEAGDEAERPAPPLSPPLSLPCLTVGREEGCHIRLADDRVSRRHAVIERDGLRLTVRDCGSTNGTFLNGQPLRGVSPLNYGDRIRFAHFDFVCEMRKRRL